MLGLRALHHLALRVRDLGGAQRFYQEVLGLPLARLWHHPDGALRSVWLQLDQAALLMLEEVPADFGPLPAAPPAAEVARRPRLGLELLAFAIAAAEAPPLLARLQAANIPIEHRTRFTFYFRDPEGNRLALSHWPTPPQQPPASPPPLSG